MGDYANGHKEVSYIGKDSRSKLTCVKDLERAIILDGKVTNIHRIANGLIQQIDIEQKQ